MGLRATWFDDYKHIILYEFDGQWTWDDLSVLVEQANGMTRSVEHQVDTIIDLRRNQSYPFGALMRFRSLTATAPVIGGWRFLSARMILLEICWLP